MKGTKGTKDAAWDLNKEYKWTDNRKDEVDR